MQGHVSHPQCRGKKQWIMQTGSLHCGEALVAAERNQIGRCRMSFLKYSLPFCSVPLLPGWLFKRGGLDWQVYILISPTDNILNNPLCVSCFLLCLEIKILYWFTTMQINEQGGSCSCNKTHLTRLPLFWCVHLCIPLHIGAHMYASTCEAWRSTLPVISQVLSTSAWFCGPLVL